MRWRAFASALADWPTDGVPRNPEAWLMTVAWRRQTDAWRRRQCTEAADHLRLMAEEVDAAREPRRPTSALPMSPAPIRRSRRVCAHR
jgi:predicted RNA polymerase sigma factor